MAKSIAELLIELDSEEQKNPNSAEAVALRARIENRRRKGRERVKRFREAHPERTHGVTRETFLAKKIESTKKQIEFYRAKASEDESSSSAFYLDHADKAEKRLAEYRAELASITEEADQ